MRRNIVILVTNLEKLILNESLVARTIVGGLLISHDIRRDTCLIFHLMNEEYSMIFRGASLRRIYPDESSLGGVLRKTFRAIRSSRHKSSPHTGVIVLKRGFNDLVKECHGAKYWVANTGEDPLKMDLAAESINVFIPMDVDCSIVQKSLREAIFKPLKIPLAKFTIDQIVAVVQFLIDWRLQKLG